MAVCNSQDTIITRGARERQKQSEIQRQPESRLGEASFRITGHHSVFRGCFDSRAGLGYSALDDIELVT